MPFPVALRVPGNQTFPGMSSTGAPIPGKSWPERQAGTARMQWWEQLSQGSLLAPSRAVPFQPRPSPTHVLVHGLRDELALAVDAGVGSLAGDLLLLLGNAARRRRAPAGVQGA